MLSFFVKKTEFTIYIYIYMQVFCNLFFVESKLFLWNIVLYKLCSIQNRRALFYKTAEFTILRRIRERERCTFDIFTHMSHVFMKNLFKMEKWDMIKQWRFCRIVE